jgi:transcriptional regulator with XRE-family HTH domain
MTSRNDLRAEIRQFLTTRRAKVTPEGAGLPTYGGNRRVPGLRREEVALLAGISIEYYTRLERGNAGGVSEEVLDGIARALKLDEVERAHLIDLVRTANAARPSRRRGTQQRVRPSVQRLLDSMTGVLRRLGRHRPRRRRQPARRGGPRPVRPGADRAGRGAVHA